MAKSTRLKCTLAVSAAMASVLIAGATLPAQAGFYTDKSIEMLVPFSPGGGNDTFARLLETQYRACIPDAKSVQVVNVPGGGTVNGANEFELRRKADGLTVMVTSGTTAYAWLLGRKGVRYSPRNWTAVLGLPGGGVVYVNPNTGVKNMKDLVSTKTELVFGGISATGLDLLALLTFEILGIKPKAVLGYRGKGPVQIAYQQGEINLDYQTTPAYIKLVKSQVDAGKAIPLYSAGMVRDGQLVRDPAFPNLPSFLEAYRDAHGKDPSGPAWEAYLALVSSGVSAQRQMWMLKKTPPEALAAMKAATECVIKREELYTKGKKILAGYKPIVGDALDRNTKSMLAVSDDVLKWLRRYLNKKYELGLTE